MERVFIRLGSDITTLVLRIKLLLGQRNHRTPVVSNVTLSGRNRFCDVTDKAVEMFAARA